MDDINQALLPLWNLPPQTPSWLVGLALFASGPLTNTALLAAFALLAVKGPWRRMGWQVLLALALACGGFGGGDVKLCAACGLLLGWQAMLVAAALSALAGGAAAVVQLVGRKAGRRTQMPFGPFLAFGVIAGLLYGQEIAAWYASLLH